MAISYDNSGSLVVIGSGTTSTSFTTGSASKKILLVNAGTKITGLTYGGVALTNVVSYGSSIIDGNQQTINLWALVNPASGANTLQATIPFASNELIGFASYQVIDDVVSQPEANAGAFSNNGINNTQVASLTASVNTTSAQAWSVMLTRGAYNGGNTFSAGIGTLRESSTSIFDGVQSIIDSGGPIATPSTSTLRADCTAGSTFMVNLIISIAADPSGGMLLFFP